mmetsp:Transcript_11293/g.28982  ORF Transcript_11293/g.28982 Transcript_11293/m.28982 type:complete len:170 (-) Transcript_11293:204-713(-)|eukprot:jgi/Tetstr1/461832/TSEL_006911.t1
MGYLRSLSTAQPVAAFSVGPRAAVRNTARPGVSLRTILPQPGAAGVNGLVPCRRMPSVVVAARSDFNWQDELEEFYEDGDIKLEPSYAPPGKTAGKKSKKSKGRKGPAPEQDIYTSIMMEDAMYEEGVAETKRSKGKGGGKGKGRRQRKDELYGDDYVTDGDTEVYGYA